MGFPAATLIGSLSFALVPWGDVIVRHTQPSKRLVDSPVIVTGHQSAAFQRMLETMNTGKPFQREKVVGRD